MRPLATAMLCSVFDGDERALWELVIYFRHRLLSIRTVRIDNRQRWDGKWSSASQPFNTVSRIPMKSIRAKSYSNRPIYLRLPMNGFTYARPHALKDLQ